MLKEGEDIGTRSRKSEKWPGSKGLLRINGVLKLKNGHLSWVAEDDIPKIHRKFGEGLLNPLYGIPTQMFCIFKGSRHSGSGGRMVGNHRQW